MLDIHTHILNIANQFKREGTALVRSNIQQANLVVSGELLNSIETQINADANRLIYEISLISTEYASMVDSRQKTVRMAAADVLTEYVKAKGLENFQFIPGYRNTIPSLDVAARRIAWGMINGNKARGKYKTQYTPNVVTGPYRKLWRKYQDQIVTAMATQTADKIFDEIKMKSGKKP